MNQIVLLLAIVFIVTVSAKSLPPNEDDLAAWKSFKKYYKKVYKSESEELLRRSIFISNKHLVDGFDLRNDTGTLKVALNHLSDLSKSEMMARNGFKFPIGKSLKNTRYAEKFLQSILNNNNNSIGGEALPDSVDWRDVPNRVTRVKDQGDCGSCWAFASTGVLEGQMAVRRNMTFGNGDEAMIELSEQNLIDCVVKDKGCKGGTMQDALEFIKLEGGIDDEKSYPYEAKSNQCSFEKEKVAFSDTGAALLPMGDEEKLKEVVAKFGPVAVAIDASDPFFQMYSDGVYFNKRCHNKPEDLNHALLVVGYTNIEPYGECWIIKNSWGEDWGLYGYAYMIRNDNNNCGIATMATIPTF